MKYVIYSHTDFSDILKLQTEFFSGIDDKILLINQNSLDFEDVYSKYSQVICYDDSLPYARRLLKLSELNTDYILLMHDIDLLIHHDKAVIEDIVSYMRRDNIDRVDLQVRYLWDKMNENKIHIHTSTGIVELRRQENINNYIYNVNPSIWKLTTLLEIMNTFNTENYRNIENPKVMEYCSRFQIYKLYSDEYIRCGWLNCLPFFQFIHITHHGELLPRQQNNLDINLKPIYKSIIDRLLSAGCTRKFSKRRLSNTM